MRKNKRRERNEEEKMQVGDLRQMRCGESSLHGREEIAVTGVGCWLHLKVLVLHYHCQWSTITSSAIAE